MEETGPLPEEGRPDAEADIRLAVDATRPANTGNVLDQDRLIRVTANSGHVLT